jgi:hypothetical protein
MLESGKLITELSTFDITELAMEILEMPELNAKRKTFSPE